LFELAVALGKLALKAFLTTPQEVSFSLVDDALEKQLGLKGLHQISFPS
jgi:hypothetical protein